ncbi:MAG TPA: LysR family transcriptional regulator [Duganella sp.]|nr:LysR family transcriptional regulator [Duganella sp.]
MIKIEDLRLMATLARSESLSEAARALNVTPSALSMRLRALERELGLSLAMRTARMLTLSADGELLAQEAGVLLARLEQLPDLFERGAQSMKGKLRVSAPFGYGRLRIAPLIVRLARLHPELTVQLDLRETPWPERAEADIVFHIGSVRDSSWVARTIADNQRWVCASPAYLQQNGEPRTPRDLLHHACICIRENNEDVTLWHFRTDKGGAEARWGARESIRIHPAMQSNDGGTARYWAEQGLGLVLRSQWDVEEVVRQGRLVRVLQPWQFDAAPILILVPSSKNLPSRVRTAFDFFVEALRAE